MQAKLLHKCVHKYTSNHVHAHAHMPQRLHPCICTNMYRCTLDLHAHESGRMRVHVSLQSCVRACTHECVRVSVHSCPCPVLHTCWDAHVCGSDENVLLNRNTTPFCRSEEIDDKKCCEPPMYPPYKQVHEHAIMSTCGCTRPRMHVCD